MYFSKMVVYKVLNKRIVSGKKSYINGLYNFYKSFYLIKYNL